MVALPFVLFLVAGCTSAPALDAALRAPTSAPALGFGVDTFAFANENRVKYRGKPDLYANWCFVMARAVTQFHRFARFDPAASPVTADEYTERVRQVTARPAQDPCALEDWGAQVVVHRDAYAAALALDLGIG